MTERIQLLQFLSFEWQKSQFQKQLLTWYQMINLILSDQCSLARLKLFRFQRIRTPINRRVGSSKSDQKQRLSEHDVSMVQVVKGEVVV